MSLDAMDGFDDYETYAVNRRHYGAPANMIQVTTQVTTKISPAYDGRTSWFAFEDAIDDWCDITELDEDKLGPALRNRLEGEAAVYKRLLDREKLRQPPGAGVAYFKRTLRPFFVKGSQTVFIYRFMQFTKFNRGNTDLLKWMTKFQINANRLLESWMGLAQYLDVNSLQFKLNYFNNSKPFHKTNSNKLGQQLKLQQQPKYQMDLFKNNGEMI